MSKTMPIPSPLNADGGSQSPPGYAHPVARAGKKDRERVAKMQQNHSFKTTKVPTWFDALLYQHGKIRKSAVNTKWLVEMITQMVSSLVARVPGEGHQLFTFPTVATTAVWPVKSASKKQLVAHLVALCRSVGITELADWGDAGSAEDPLDMESVAIIMRTKAERFADEAAHAPSPGVR